MRRAVARSLIAAGLEVCARDYVVEVSDQSVKIDLVVDDGRGERPVFIFPGVDLAREGTMFQFLHALLQEAGAFPLAPVYYSPEAFPYEPGDTVETILTAAAAFEERATEAGFHVDFDTPPDELVGILRALAATPVESGGAEQLVEAAAFIGCWMLQRATGRWEVREDLPRTVLLLRSEDGSVVYEFPLFALFPDAVRTGYDGFLTLFHDLTADLTGRQHAVSVEALPTYPMHLAPVIRGWLLEATALGSPGHAAILARRCASCGELVALEALPQVPVDDGAGALQAALVLAAPEAPPCPGCGSTLHSGTLAAYLLPERRKRGEAFLVTAYVSSTFLRVSFHHVKRGGTVLPTGQLPD
ncbi:MAG TPA: hypothetical protein VNZ52_15585 [Candidatus Thermoplasmatota archaeon]|nr:hypothetical protein [Candidatus Thermoplasmatota archaeon]